MTLLYKQTAMTGSPYVSNIAPMWGPLVYPKVDDVLGVTSIAEATYRFVHGEILDSNIYQTLLDNIIDECDETTKARGADEKMHVYKQLANQRFYGKTAIETFVAIEIAMTIATEYNPGVGFRKYLQRAFSGLLVLQQSVGPWIDVSNSLRYKYGISDTNSNLASACLWFGATFYTKTVSPSGEFVFNVAPTSEFVAKRPIGPLSDSILFDYIALLFPKTSATPVFDRIWMEYKFKAMQTRIDAVREADEMRLCGAYRYGTFGTYTDAFQSTSPGSMYMRFKQFFSAKEHVDVYASATTIMYLGTNKTMLSDTERMEIVETDAFIIPFVTDCMNHAHRVSSFRL